jgi:SAM-dependent methyltransferase
MGVEHSADYFLARFRATGGGRGLDYGCGDGGFVAQAVGEGLDFEGVESYYGQRDFQEASEARTPPEARGRISLLNKDGTMPFADETFDFVCSHQVMEHVDDLQLVVSELARVTRPGGVGVHVFPTVERVREPHLGVPWFHRVSRGRRTWARLWHTLRVAYRFSPEHDDFDSWYQGMSRFFDSEVHLRPAREIEAAFATRFQVDRREGHRLGERLGRPVPANARVRFVELRRMGSTLEVRRPG